jgi:hypothetical protein
MCNVENLVLELYSHYEFFYSNCRNLSLGLATKARAWKVMGQEGTSGVTSHAFGSVRECEGKNPHIFK